MDILPPHSLRETAWHAEPRIGPREVIAVLTAIGLFVWAILRVV